MDLVFFVSRGKFPYPLSHRLRILLRRHERGQFRLRHQLAQRVGGGGGVRRVVAGPDDRRPRAAFGIVPEHLRFLRAPCCSSCIPSPHYRGAREVFLSRFPVKREAARTILNDDRGRCMLRPMMVCVYPI